MEEIYAVVFLDAIHYHVRSEGQSVKKAVYIAIGIDLDGKKDVLGMWVSENESAKFWATVLNSLKNRGVEDVFIACTDNLTVFSAAIEAVFPKTEIQNCIVHQLRNSNKYVSYKDLKALMPVIVRDLDDDEAIIIMVDSNLQREKILPSEKAFAYKMKLEALKHQGKRWDITLEPAVPKLTAREKIAQDAGENCGLTVTRYIVLTKLIPPLLAFVDEAKLSLSTAADCQRR